MKKIRRFIRILKIIDPDYIFGTVGIILLIIFFTSSNYFLSSPQILPTQEVITPTMFDSLQLEAKAVYVYDVVDKRELYGRNSDAQLPLASLTKVMTAVTALSLLSGEAIVTITPDDLKEEGDSGLFENERWQLADLVDLTLLESSNDGASAIADYAGRAGTAIVSDKFGRGVFIDAMNEKASELGLTQTYYLNPTGLDENILISGAYGSARDTAILFSHAVKTYPQIFDATRSESREYESLSLIKHKVKNTNTFVSKIPSLLASKTGFTDLAGGNLVIAFDAGLNHPIVVSVLGSSEKGRFADAEKLVFATLDYLANSN